MGTGMDVLSVKRINGVMSVLRDTRELPQQLKWVNRTPRTPATDGEIMARYQGNVAIADVLLDDAVAPVRHTGQFTLERTVVPNVKTGRLFTQEFLNTLQRINAGGGIPDDQGYLSDYINREVDAVRLAMLHRDEQLIVQMMLDTLSHDALGVKFSGVSWGRPSDLKVTVSPLWSSPSTATPIDNILALKYLAMEKYGEMYNRITLHSTSFRQLIATDEFKAKAQLYSQIQFPTGSFPSQDLGPMRSIVGLMLDMEVELYDQRYWAESDAGAFASSPFNPTNVVFLTDSSDDGDRMVRDLADTVVTETVVSSLTGGGGVTGIIGGFDAPSRGPVAYAAPSPGLNPPQLTLFGVERVFPRLKRQSSVGTLTVA